MEKGAVELRARKSSNRIIDVGVELGVGISLRLADRVEQLLGHTKTINIDQVWLEEGLRGLESLTSDLDDTTVREL